MKCMDKARKALARKRQQGLTLIEAAMVLGVAALVIAGVLVLYNTANPSNKTSEALNQLNVIQNAVRNVYGGTAGFAGLDAATMVSSKALPQKMLSAAGTTGIKNSFNGDIDVVGTDANFIVSFTGIPSDACVALTTKDYGRSLDTISINGTAKTAGTLLTPADVTGDCSTVGNSIDWKFLN